MSDRFTVISILREPLAQTLGFAAWYLEAGADRILMYLDNPDDAALPWLESHPKIDVTRCTPAFWDESGISTDIRFSRRQNMVMTRAYRRVETGWVLNVDGDEFVYIAGNGLSDVFAAQPEEISAVRFRPVELIGQDAYPETCFRLPMRLGVRRDIYGENAALFARKRDGLVGHSVGKSATRAGLPGLTLRQHWAQNSEGVVPPTVELGPADGAYLLHMIGESYESWRSKLDWRMASRGFAPGLTDRIEEVLRLEDPEHALRDLHGILHRASETTLSKMEAHNSLLRLSLDFEGLVAHHFPIA